ncbi:response regulator [Thiohalobacter sp. IOR34]|uniref:HD domain-containing phosphohydrolase n=1 Tax=Thiohalobacter sp. IOR34 TaxID=3057176 RepID=UPI0025B07095|nr:HD domain-containing phosphohydrolase [Thiohalobacter sp. IOR34]WJW74387.1 response regulator [Thiohalobacter sp. IOR34]
MQRVLIVDDEESHRSLEKEILSGAEYLVREAKDAFEALDRLREEDFDVVLLDKRMPGMDGDELCRRIRNELGMSLLPIIMVTASNDHVELARSLRAGANDFIRKPYNPLELMARVNAAITQKRLTDQLDSAESLLFTLARMVEAKDTHTGDHCSRLAHAAVVFGETLGVADEELLALRRGGVLHDIGKLGVPDAILLKAGPLSGEEWEVMRQHTVIGAQLCSSLKSMRLTVPIIRSHHERWDGSGYPDGLKGEEIPLLARIFQLVDIYDALAHERPYKERWPLARIIAAFEEEVSKGWREPELTAVFLDILRNRPDELLPPEDEAEGPGARIFEDVFIAGLPGSRQETR